VNVFFDVQGTLVAHGVGRPHAGEVFRRLAAGGHDVYLWSSAGGGYAREAARLLGVEDVVLGCFSKLAEPPVPVDLVVDDDAGFAGGDGLLVRPFDGDPEDRELLRVAGVVEGLAGSGPSL
jgi:hypothetical protein